MGTLRILVLTAGISSDMNRSVMVPLIQMTEPMCVITHPQQAMQQHTGNDILAQVKRQHKDIKDIIRVTFPQEKWINYGVFDKR